MKNGNGKIVFIKPIDFWCNDFGGFDDLILKYFADSRMIDVLSSQRYSLSYYSNFLTPYLTVARFGYKVATGVRRLLKCLFSWLGSNEILGRDH
ncbi:MAG: hypothetical protein ABIW48_09710, partial [Burkholderiales bacterium]